MSNTALTIFYWVVCSIAGGVVMILIETIWGGRKRDKAWAEPCAYTGPAVAEDSMNTFKSINRGQEYRIVPRADL